MPPIFVSVLSLAFLFGAPIKENENPNSGLNAAQSTESNVTEISDEFRQDALKLLDLNKELAKRFRIVQASFVKLTQRIPGVKQEFWTECQNLMDRKELANQLVEVYAKYYTHQDVKDLIAFYESPLGKKLMSKGVLVESDSNRKANSYGAKIGIEIREKLADAGYIE